MALSSTTSRVDYTGSGTTLTYSYTFKAFASSDLLVTVRKISTGVETVLSLTTHYTLTGVGETAGGTVVLVNGAFDWISGGFFATTYTLTIRRVREFTQTTSIRNQTDIFRGTLEDTFDKVVMLTQQLDNDVDRSIRLPETVSPASVSTLLPVPVANQGFRWNGGATALENYSLAAAGSIVLPGSAGIAVYNGSSTFGSRTLTPGSAIAITNGDGQSGNPTVAVDINGLTVEANAASDDTIPFYDTSALANRKMTSRNLLVLGHATSVVADTADYLLIDDTSAPGLRKILLSNALIQGHAAETAAASDDTVLMSDTSALGALRKMAASDFLINGHTAETAIETGDLVLFSDSNSSNVMRKATLLNALIAGHAATTSPSGSDTVLINSGGSALRKITLTNLGQAITPAAASISFDKLKVTSIINADQAVGIGATVSLLVQNTGATTANTPYIYSFTPNGGGNGLVSVRPQCDCNNGDTELRFVEEGGAAGGTVRVRVNLLNLT